MNIGIIGAGHIGSTLARKLTALGHGVRIANSRGPETLTQLAAETGARAVTTEEAVQDVDLVVVTIPEKNVPNLPPNLFKNVPQQVVVVDTGNYYPMRDGRIEAIENGQPESAWVAGHLGRRVIKAFNNIIFFSLADGSLPRGTPNRIALPVAGDDARDKGTLMKLIDELGFDGVDAGTLDESWRQQPGAPCYCTDLPAEKLQRALAKTDRAKSPQVRDASWSLLANTPREQVVPKVRELSGANAL